MRSSTVKNTSSILGLAAALSLALTACTGGGGESETAEPTGGAGDATATESGDAQAGEDKVYSVDELRDLISGMTDEDGNELKLYSEDEVEQGSQIAELLLTTAAVNPEECKSIATAGLLDSVEGNEVAVAISEGDEPRTLSAQSGEEGPSATELLDEVSGTMDQCKEFTIEAAGQELEVTTEELDAETDAEQTFATVSTRGNDDSQMLMQVSAAEGRLLVVATKGGADLGDEDQQELEDLINQVLSKAEEGSGETPADTETSDSTESPSTGDATDEATDEATDGATDEATDQATEDATEEATNEPTEGSGG
jgi:hypothetical protein